MCTLSTITDRRRVLTTNDVASERVGTVLNPTHLGELIRENMDDVGYNVTETATRRGCERGAVAPAERQGGRVGDHAAVVLEDSGWGTVEHWMRMQASYELAHARRDRTAAQRRTRELHALSRLAATLFARADAPIVERRLLPRR